MKLTAHLALFAITVPNSVITDDARLYRRLITYTVTDPVP